jgi:hypothetical protein
VTGRAPQRAWPVRADVLIAVAALVVFAWGLVTAMGFPTRAGLVPRLVCGAGFVLSVLFLLRQAFGRPGGGAAANDPPGGAENDEDDGGEAGAGEDSPWSAGAGTWIRALAWFGGFFAGLWLLGTLVTVPVFALAYLLVVGRTRVWAAVTYAAVAWAALYVVFDWLLRLPLPSGALL